MKKKKKEKNYLVYVMALVFLMIDQITKLLFLKKDYVIIKNIFQISPAKNYGAAWSIFNNQVYFIIFISIMILVLMNSYYKTFHQNKRNMLGFSLIFGGLVGNLSDRIYLGYVRDFLAFKIFGYNFPIFNLADIFITGGIIFLIIAVIKGEDHLENIKK